MFLKTFEITNNYINILLKSQGLPGVGSSNYVRKTLLTPQVKEIILPLSLLGTEGYGPHIRIHFILSVTSTTELLSLGIASSTELITSGTGCLWN